MKYFFSGSTPAAKSGHLKPGFHGWLINSCPWRLFSIHGSYVKEAHKWLKELKPETGQEIMLDSGAYSAWQAGGVATLDQVIAKYDQILSSYSDRVAKFYLINLDVIPGVRGGGNPTQDVIRAALHESDKNYAILKDRFGDRVLPVFHQFEDDVRLREVIALNPEYICVSPSNGLHESERLPFARSTHVHLKKMSPDTKTHSLGATGFEMMTTIPWYSVDSTAWVMVGAMGDIVYFNGDGMVKVSMSERDASGEIGRDHWRNIDEHLREKIVQFGAQHDLTVDALRDTHAARIAFNMLAMIEMTRNAVLHALPEQEDLFA